MALTTNLINWYKQHHRDLPWRQTHNPYYIWLSEIILQQTRIEQGLPYYQKFISKYPTIIDLANAPEDEVLKLWQGLGYYSRARNLQHTAQIIRDECAGKFPSDYTAIRGLKGIGDYTAAAISSFAFDLPKAVVDGNVLRVLSRIYNSSTPIDTASGKKEFQQIADDLLPKDHYNFNQGIMELGAKICTPKQPKCEECPVSVFCLGKSNWRELPVKSKKLKKTTEHLYFFILTDGSKVILEKRDNSGIWKGLYQFPLIVSPIEKSPEILLQDMGFPNQSKLQLVSSFKHLLTHKTLICHFYRVMVDNLGPYH